MEIRHGRLKTAPPVERGGNISPVAPVGVKPVRPPLRNFGLKVGMVGTVRFEARIQELVENLPDMAALVEPLLIVPAGAARTDRHPAPPLAGHRAER
jgi:hypothetical protein